MRSLGIDYGTVRVGIAISDPLGMIATGQPTLKNEEAYNKILKIVEDEQVSKIVLGYPKNMNGTIGPMAREVEQFKEKLKKRTDIPIVLWDERLSSQEANKRMLEADLSRAKRKKAVDRTAATIILQSYLDNIRL
jgi:putative pre-16S rRNA nuclease